MARGQAHNFSAQNGEAQRVTSANMPPPRVGRASTKKLWSDLPLRSGKDYPQTTRDPSQPGGVLLLTRPEAHTGRSLTKFTMAKDTFTSDCTVGLRESIQTVWALTCSRQTRTCYRQSCLLAYALVSSTQSCRANCTGSSTHRLRSEYEPSVRLLVTRLPPMIRAAPIRTQKSK